MKSSSDKSRSGQGLRIRQTGGHDVKGFRQSLKRDLRFIFLTASFLLDVEFSSHRFPKERHGCVEAARLPAPHEDTICHTLTFSVFQDMTSRSHQLLVVLYKEVFDTCDQM